MSNNNTFGDYDPDKAGQRFGSMKTKKVEKDKSNIYRILPPQGKLRDQMKLGQYWVIHYGFAKSKNGKNIPIACAEKAKWEDKKKIITQACPLCDHHTAMKNAYEALVARPDAASQNSAGTLKARLDDMSVDKKYYLNALSQEGTVEVFKLGYKHFKALEAELKDIKAKYGIIATSLGDGLYLDFKKSGMGRDTIFTVTPYAITERKQDGSFSSTLVSSKLTDADIERISKDVKELTTLYKEFAVEDLLLVAKGDEETKRRLFTAPTSTVEDEDSGDDEGVTAGSTGTGTVGNAAASYMTGSDGGVGTTTLKQAPAPTASAPIAETVATPVATVAKVAAATTVLPPVVPPAGNLSVDEIIAQFAAGGQAK